jgi:site-specific DNA-adenine methylase
MSAVHYPGGKGASGVYQRLINQIPPHRVYIETHLGGGAIMRYKRPAEVNIGIDLDPKVLESWRGFSGIRLICEDAASFLRRYSFQGDEFVYVDPPYLISARRSNRKLYRYEYTAEQHEELLETLVSLPCRVMISGYWSEFYESRLGAWRNFSFRVRTRSGAFVDEWVWMNYPEPEALHDYRYLGNNFRERERIKRIVLRWKRRLEQMPRLERQAVLSAMQNPDMEDMG